MSAPCMLAVSVHASLRNSKHRSNHTTRPRPQIHGHHNRKHRSNHFTRPWPQIQGRTPLGKQAQPKTRRKLGTMIFTDNPPTAGHSYFRRLPGGISAAGRSMAVLDPVCFFFALGLICLVRGLLRRPIQCIIFLSSSQLQKEFRPLSGAQIVS